MLDEIADLDLYVDGIDHVIRQRLATLIPAEWPIFNENAERDVEATCTQRITKRLERRFTKPSSMTDETRLYPCGLPRRIAPDRQRASDATSV